MKIEAMQKTAEQKQPTLPTLGKITKVALNALLVGIPLAFFTYLFINTPKPMHSDYHSGMSKCMHYMMAQTHDLDQRDMYRKMYQMFCI